VCLLFLCQRVNEQYPLILLANRDEYRARPTRRAGFWTTHPAVLAGMDLQGGGTWLGITRQGRWAALTNYREPPRAAYSRSRGELVRDYLAGGQSPADYGRAVGGVADDFDGFNLLLGDRHETLWTSNRGAGMERLQAGIHGLSNHLLETPWPKVTAGKRALTGQLRGQPVVDRLFQPLSDQTVYEAGLPDTGVEPDTEKRLSSAFINSPAYGTRSSTLIMVDRAGRAYFEERSYDEPAGGPCRPDVFSARIFQFALHC